MTWRFRWHGLLSLAGLGAGLLLLFLEPWVPANATDTAPPLEDPGPELPFDIGVKELLEELVDLPSLALWPDPPYVARMASSFDRRSMSNLDPETWFANDDWASRARPHYVRMEDGAGRREFVLLDVEGPGALVRLWTATPTGTLRVYLDGQPRPAIEAQLGELLAGTSIIPPPLAHVVARGYNAYFPIPFRTAVKVTIDDLVAVNPFIGGPLEKFYYQINYRLYAREAAPRIRSFHPNDLERAAPVLARVANVLERPASAYQPSAEHRRVPLDVAGGEATATVTRAGGGVIRQLVLRIRNRSEAALGRAMLRLLVDGELTVQAPLAEFFGAGAGLEVYESLPFSIGADGSCVCRWPMPFERSATLVVEHSPGIEGELWIEPLAWSERSLHFHARWQPELTATTRPFRDLRLLDVAGSGVYVGAELSLTNPVGARWWGEGDEKMRVDGERFPSLFGTGTEDYFGYAWSTPERFGHALHAQTRAGSGEFGGPFSMNRYHTLDAVPFSKSFAFDLELWHWEDTRVSWSAMTYYYARPGAAQRD